MLAIASTELCELVSLSHSENAQHPWRVRNLRPFTKYHPLLANPKNVSWDSFQKPELAQPVCPQACPSLAPSTTQLPLARFLSILAIIQFLQMRQEERKILDKSSKPRQHGAKLTQSFSSRSNRNSCSWLSDFGLKRKQFSFLLQNYYHHMQCISLHFGSIS